jgi:hypothetical protein
MNAAWRAYRILAAPASEWTKIESESGDAAYLLSGYEAPLALVPAVSGFIGACIIGVAVPATGTLRAPIFDGLFGAVFGYVLSCATVLILALLIDLVAPLFGGRRSFDAAFKLAVYSYTPVWLVGIFLLAPGLHFLGLLGLYGAYLLWIGLPQLMKTPEQKLQIFAAVIVACACALFFIAAAAQRALFAPAGSWL